MIELLSRRYVIAALLGSALALFLGAGCANPPMAAEASAATFAGQAAALAVGVVAPEAAPFVETAAAAIRSLPVLGTPPTAASVQSEVALWVGKLPISATARTSLVSEVAAKYSAALPDLQKADNAADALEDFADGLGGAL